MQEIGDFTKETLKLQKAQAHKPCLHFFSWFSYEFSSCTCKLSVFAFGMFPGHLKHSSFCSLCLAISPQWWMWSAQILTLLARMSSPRRSYTENVILAPCYQVALNRTELGLQLLDPNDLESNDSRAYPPSKELPNKLNLIWGSAKNAANTIGAVSKMESMLSGTIFFKMGQKDLLPMSLWMSLRCPTLEIRDSKIVQNLMIFCLHPNGKLACFKLHSQLFLPLPQWLKKIAASLGCSFLLLPSFGVSFLHCIMSSIVVRILVAMRTMFLRKTQGPVAGWKKIIRLKAIGPLWW